MYVCIYVQYIQLNAQVQRIVVHGVSDLERSKLDIFGDHIDKVYYER